MEGRDRDVEPPAPAAVRRLDRRRSCPNEFRRGSPDPGGPDRNQGRGAACCAPTPKRRRVDHDRGRYGRSARSPAPRAPRESRAYRARAHGQLDEQRQRRLRDRVLYAACFANRPTAQPPNRHSRGCPQRRHVGSLPGDNRRDRRSHLQFIIARRDRTGLSWHCAGPARRLDDHDPQTSRSRPPMSEGLSPNLQHPQTSATIAISAEAKRRKAAGEDVIDLGAGEPDFPTPPIPADAGIRAIKDGKTHYSANEGILELRAAAATHLSLLSGGRPVNADHIVVSSGSKQSLFNACFTLFGPGEVVAIPSPAWVSYPQIVHLARARPVLVSGDPEWSLKLSVKDLDRVVPGAQGLMLCSPCNPTGGVYTHGEIRAIAEWARKRGEGVLADQINRRIHYGPGPAPSFLDLPDELLERVVVVYGVSKAYAMTGWRIGLAPAPGAIPQAVAALQSHTTTGGNTPAP